MDFDTQVKLAVYRHSAETGRGPAPDDVALRVQVPVGDGRAAYARRVPFV